MEQNASGPKDPKDPVDIHKELERSIFMHPEGPDGFVNDIETDEANTEIIEELSKVADLFTDEQDKHPGTYFYKGLLIGLYLSRKILSDKEMRQVKDAIAFILAKSSNLELSQSVDRKNYIISESSKELMKRDSKAIRLIPTASFIGNGDHTSGHYVLNGLAFMYLVMRHAKEISNTLDQLDVLDQF